MENQPQNSVEGILFDNFRVLIAPPSAKIGGSWQGEPIDDIPTAWDTKLLKFIYERTLELDSITLLDIGANTGSFCLLPKLNPNIKCYAFEPNPGVFDLLNRNLYLNQLQDKVKLFQIALSNQKGTAVLKLPSSGTESGLASLGNPLRFNSWTEVEVPMVTLDEFITSEDISKVDLIKIETEGCELFVLKGAESLIKTDHPGILLEYCRNNTHQFDYEPEAIVELLFSWGYQEYSALASEDLYFYSFNPSSSPPELIKTLKNPNKTLVDKLQASFITRCTIFGTTDIATNQQALTWCDQGIQLFALNQFNEARFCFEQATSISSEIGGAYYAQAICLVEIGLWKEAAAALEQEMNVRFPHPYTQSLLQEIKTKIETKYRHSKRYFQFTKTKPLTLFAIPKPFSGHTGIIQRNAIISWTKLRYRPDIILLGNEVGTAEIAKELGLKHIPDVECSEFGTPLVNSIFQLAEANSTTDWLAYLNSDIILLDDFSKTLITLQESLEESKITSFLLASQRINIEIDTLILFDQDDYQEQLQKKLQTQGVLDKKLAMDLFLYTRGVCQDIPPLAIGRPAWDNWLIWKVKQSGAAIIDATESFLLIHQSHDYRHLAGGYQEVYKGKEADRNRALAGSNLIGLTEACTHSLTDEGLILGSSPEKASLVEVFHYRVSKGHEELNKGNYPGALDYFESALDCTVPFIVVSVHLACAICLIQMQKFEEARQAIVKEIINSDGSAKAKELLIQLNTQLFNFGDINLLIFPDWTTSEEILYEELARVINDIESEPRYNQVTLLVNANKKNEEKANLIFSTILMDLSFEKDIDLSERIEISVLNLDPIEWKVLASHIQEKINLINEDKESVAQAGI